MWFHTWQLILCAIRWQPCSSPWIQRFKLVPTICCYNKVQILRPTCPRSYMCRCVLCADMFVVGSAPRVALQQTPTGQRFRVPSSQSLTCVYHKSPQNSKGIVIYTHDVHVYAYIAPPLGDSFVLFYLPVGCVKLPTCDSSQLETFG